MDVKNRILIVADEQKILNVIEAYLIYEHKTKVDKIATIIDDLYDEQTGFSDSNKEEVLRYFSAEALYIEINLISLLP